MDFDWHRAKSSRNACKRGLPFELAAFLFRKPTLEIDDERHDYGERRIQAYGELNGRVMVCVFTDRERSGRSLRWIISLRKANSREARKYYEWIEAKESG